MKAIIKKSKPTSDGGFNVCLEMRQTVGLLEVTKRSYGFSAIDVSKHIGEETSIDGLRFRNEVSTDKEGRSRVINRFDF